MAEQVTRKFTNKTDGTPRTGLNLRLVSLTAPSADPYPFVEVVTAVEADQGQYYVAAPGGTSIVDVPHGVYQIQRDAGAGYTNFEGMITVEPGRVEGLEANKFPLSDRVNTAITQVSAFMGDTEDGTLAVIQRALNYAATTTKYVKVGAWGPAGANVIWTGSPITVPDGVTLDLCGATLYADSANDLPVLSIPGDAAVMNGSLKTKFASGSRVATIGESSFRVLFSNIDFIVGNAVYPTAADSVNLERSVLFVSCSNVIMAPKSGTSDTRAQVAIGCEPCFEVGGSTNVSGPAHANATAQDVGGLVRTGLNALGTAPDATAPFADMKEFAEAVKQLWFVKQPATDAAIADLETEIGDVPFIWTGASGPSNLNGDPAKISIGTMDPAGFSISAYGCSVLERKAKSRGAGTSAVIDISVIAAIKISYSGMAGGDDLIIGADIDMSDMESAFAAENPGYLSITNSAYCLDSSFISGVYDVYGYGLASVPADSPVWGLQYPQCWMETGKIKFLTLRVEIGNLGIPASGDIYFIAEIKASVPIRLSADHATAGNPAFGTSMGFNPVAR